MYIVTFFTSAKALVTAKLYLLLLKYFSSIDLPT